MLADVLYNLYGYTPLVIFWPYTTSINKSQPKATQTTATQSNEFSQVYDLIARQDKAIERQNKVIDRQNIRIADMQSVVDAAHKMDQTLNERNQMIVTQASIIEARETVIAERDSTIKDNKATISGRNDVIAMQAATITARVRDLAARDVTIIERDVAIAELQTAIADRDRNITMLQTVIADRDSTIAERDDAIEKLHEVVRQGDLANECLKRVQESEQVTISQLEKDNRSLSFRNKKLILNKLFDDRSRNAYRRKYEEEALKSVTLIKEVEHKNSILKEAVDEKEFYKKELSELVSRFYEMHAVSVGELLEINGLYSSESGALKKENRCLSERNIDLERYLSLSIKENLLLNELSSNPSGLADDILLNIFCLNEVTTEHEIDISDQLLQLHNAIQQISQKHRAIEGEYASILNSILNATVSVDHVMNRKQRKLRPEEFHHYRLNIEKMIGKYQSVKISYNDMVCRLTTCR